MKEYEGAARRRKIVRAFRIEEVFNAVGRMARRAMVLGLPIPHAAVDEQLADEEARGYQTVLPS